MSAMAAQRSSPRSSSIWHRMCSTVCCSLSVSASACITLGSPSISLPAAKRTGMPALCAWSSVRCMMACRQRCTAPPCSEGLQKSLRSGFSRYLATCMACCTSSSTPSFFMALMGMTGMPSMRSISLMRNEPPLPSTSSIMLRASTMGMSSSMSCMVRYRLRSIQEPSTMLMMPSGWLRSMNSRLTISSLV